MEVFNRLIIPWWLFMLYFQPGSVEPLSDVKISSDDLRSSKFRRLTIHQNQGTVFIGTENRLYKLSSDLKLLANVASRLSDNTNLLINYKDSELISCGGTYSYWCSFFNLNGDIRQLDFTKQQIFSYKKKNFTNATTVAFFGKNNPVRKLDELTNPIYFVMPYCENSVNDSALFVATKSKDGRFKVHDDNAAQNPEKFDAKHRNKYKVNYVYGFSSGKYNYILTTQQNSTTHESSYISKLIRLCDNGDSLLQGYTEIPIECKFNNNQTYNFVQAATIGKPSLNIATSMHIEPDDDVLFGVFSKSQNEETLLNKFENQGALCIYSIKATNEKFTENIQNCFKGEGYLGFDTTIPNQPCAEINKTIDSNFCSLDVNMPLVGNMSITGYPSITFDQIPTAIASKTSESHHYVFIGTNIGHLKRIIVKTLTNACAEADLPLKERSPVNSDLLFSPNQDYLYVMTEHYLTRLRVPQNSTCSEYIDYNTCLQNSASCCGWCGLNHKCTVRCDCFYNNFELWYSSDFRKSIQILGSNSLKFQIGTVGPMQLNISALPQIRDQFSCYFIFSNHEYLSTKGSLNQTASNYNLVSCEIPEASKIPSLSKNGHHLNATLTISTINIRDIVKINVTYFDCKTFISCKACISSEFSCIWCPKEKKCHEAITDCAKSNFTEFQPNITISSDKKTAIEFPSMKSYDVCETTSNLKCLINIEGKTVTKSVVMKNNDFYCENTTYTYAKNTSKMNATVSIMWKIHNFVNILSKRSVIIYKCPLMAENCTSCSTLNTEYNCGWCRSSNTCEFQNNREDQRMGHINSCQQKEVKIIGNSSKFQIGAVGNIQLKITTLPQTDDDFSCNFVFADKSLSTQANVNEAVSNYSIILCETPRKHEIPLLPKNEHYLNGTLSISTNHFPNIAKMNITFFDCRTYNSCKACSSSGFSCIWCPKENKCTFSAITDCAKSNFTEFQPNITISSDKKTAIEFPNMKSYDVCETTSNLKCLINIEGKTDTKNVVMKNNYFYCENTTYTYAKNTSKINATVSIMWKISNFIDILSKTSVIIYKCQLMANNCTSCLTLNTEYNCGWYRSSNSCEFQGDCDDQVLRHINTCTDSPPPSILSVSPLQGLCEGGTNVTIKGESLGYTFEDINQRIFVAGVACTPYREMYEPMKSITCVTDKSSALPGHEGPVVIYVNKKPVVSKQNFKFVDPKILEVSPNSGPIYGGTELTIKGENLAVGKLVQVLIGDILCTIFLLTSDVIKCVTNSSAEKNATVSMQFDKNVRNLINNTFKYVRDKERDEKGFNIQPKGIPSGGVTIFIHIAVPKPAQELVFHLYNEGYVYESPCKLHNDSILNCSSPYIPDIPNDSIDVKNPRKMNFSIKANFTNDSIPLSEKQASKFLLYPDPQFQYFLNSSVEIDEESFVIIKGKNINNACQKNDIKVNVGNHTCDVISISSNQLICRLPKLSSSNQIDDSEQKYDFLAEHDKITVSIGTDFRVIVPRESSSPDKNPNTEYLIYVVITSIVIVILSITSIAFLCLISKKRVTKTVKKLKKTQLQMTRLELRVASECKEAFTELQTQAAAFIVADSCTHLPFLNYHNYVMNILFPSINDHSIILHGKAILIHKEKGLRLFEELIMNRRFLLSFVRTLENQGTFSMNDRVHVASMIMITLQKDMKYCTDILKTLLAELIEKNMQGKSHPKLLLRRTESVVEKMLSAWFSFLLYKFLKKSAGRPLFNLFIAIKEHVSRGPIDMITSQARYCLSENKILRLKFDYRPLTIYVNISQQTAKIIELESAIEKVPVLVLDCDTISQFKEKAVDAIHRKINFTRSLNPSELNVKWFRDTACTFILSDEDSGSITEGEWRQINTLKHYNVPDGSVLNLISDKEINYRTLGMMPILNRNQLKNNIKLKSTISFSNTRKKSLTESTTALIPGSDLHLKEWHLIKPFNSQGDEVDRNENHAMMPEIYLTRLLATKSSLQRFVDELFNVIFKKNNQNSCFPIAIKYMFDFLDDQARLHNITDPEVVHVWKNNCLPLRFWVNLIKNPNFLFDVHKSNIVDSCFTVIAQVFMDSCSISEQHFNKDSATTKLLYAKEIPIYNKSVKRYYADIKNMPRISSQDMNTMLAKVSKKYATDFDANMSIHELFKYATKYKEKLFDALKNDEFSKDNLLVLKLEEVMEIISAVSNL